jgi:DNA invertase Pin-like site-specific DNA recombinase
MDKAICYIRVSTEEQARGGVSLEAQEEKVLAYCKMQGLEILEIVREEGVSASKPLASRPGGARVVEALSKGKASHVVALKLDRLFRDAVDALSRTREWDAKGVALHLVDMGGQAINTSTAMGRFFLGTMAGFAELERNLISERTSIALAHKRNNKQAYGPTPFGYIRTGDLLEESPGELSLVKNIREHKENGWSLRKIAEWLNSMGAPTKKGGRWYASTVRYVLQNSLYMN